MRVLLLFRLTVYLFARFPSECKQMCHGLVKCVIPLHNNLENLTADLYVFVLHVGAAGGAKSKYFSNGWVFAQIRANYLFKLSRVLQIVPNSFQISSFPNCLRDI